MLDLYGVRSTPVIAIAPRFTISCSGSTRKGPIYRSKGIKQCLHAKLNCLKWNSFLTLNFFTHAKLNGLNCFHISLCVNKKMYLCLTELFEMKLLICIKMNLALNDVQWLICHKIKLNHTLSYCFT